MLRMTLLLCLVVGADGPDSSLIEGKSIRDWIAISQKGSPDEKIQAVKMLKARFKDDTEAIDLATIEALCKDRDEAVKSGAIDFFLDAMQNDDLPAVQLLSIYAFRKIALDNSKVTATLLKVVSSGKENAFRVTAIGTLMERKPPSREAAPVLLAALKKDKDVSVRRWAAYAVAEILPCKEAFLPLIGALKDQESRPLEFSVGETAMIALSRLGHEAIALLGARLEDPDPEIRASVVWALGHLHDPGLARLKEEAHQKELLKFVPKVRKRCKDRSADVRAAAIGALGYMLDDSPETVAAFGEALADSNIGVVGSALHSIQRLGEKAAPTLDRVVKCASHENADVRWMSIEAIECIGRSDAPVVPTIIRALSDKNRHVRRAATRALGVVGRDRKDVLDELRKLAEDDDEGLREAAKDAIERLQKPADK
jgi:HEAT repeat protein